MVDFDLKTLAVIAPNLNRRLSGVTSTIVRLVPLQQKTIAIRSFGVGLPDETPTISLTQLLRVGYGKAPIVWHARRNTEMLLGIVLKHIFRKNLKLLFTSASQRHHTSYTKFLIGQMDRIIATSKAGSKYLKHECDIVYHGINIADFSPISKEQASALKLKLGLPNQKLIGCFGRIRKQKGTDVFIDSMIRLLPENPGWSALIMGRATEQHTSFLKEQRVKIAAAGLENRIIFGGEAPVDKIADYYRCLSLFIAPQRWEGFGLTPLEAMACGVPIVATKVGAFPEIILEGETGHLIDPGKIDQMVEAAGRVMDEPETLEKFSIKSRAHMEANFDIHMEAEKLVEIYREMLRI